MLRFIYLLAAGLLLSSAPAFSQTAGLRTQPIDFDNTLVVTLPDEGQAAWQRAGRLLAQRGYLIRFASPELLTLSTEPVSNFTARLMGVYLVVEGPELHLQGYIPAGDNVINWLQIIEYSTGRGLSGRRWQELEEIARLLGGTVRYARTPTH
ncbi:hypothetical protein [Hymenobacter actinosclerus]|uniref:Uncharacterized protein n=1 Tax=Hymenobacter actinosclerus TaxID=82805 RepID=A0A1I0EVH1_9BACT|nr:hypothetical protein [Hymenobacter actinosclerus]SET48889.1 hypothetical protein SAMN04487998_1995 [Hymenobacter actinosclerus]